MSIYDKEAEWLYSAADKIGKRPTEAQEEAFVERVGIKVDSGIPLQQARLQAFKEMFND